MGGLEPDQVLLNELIALKADVGVTVGKLANSLTVLSVLDRSPNEASEALDQFKAILLSLGMDRNARALRNAFGIDVQNSLNLTERRREFGENNGGRSVLTVKEWEEKAHDDLLRAINLGGFGAVKERTIYQSPYFGALWVEVAVVDGFAPTYTFKRTDSAGNAQTILVSGNTKTGDLLLPNIAFFKIPEEWTLTHACMFVFFNPVNPPQQVWGLYGPNSPDFLSGATRQLLRAEHPGMFDVRWEQPQPGAYLGVLWSEQPMLGTS